MDVKIDISDKIYLKNPDQSELGRRILQYSIVLMDEIGFESFTFKKLAERIQSTEASIYRYFENKHKLLVYLVSWYWNWLEFHFVFRTREVKDAEEKLQIAIDILSKPVEMDPTFMHIDESALHRIVVSESSKAYLTKSVDQEEKEGYFVAYKRLCSRLASIIQKVNPDYEFPTSLVSTVLETTHTQKYFASHIPSLTEVSEGESGEVATFLSQLLFRVIQKNKS